MKCNGTVTAWLEAAKRGDEVAYELLWRRYFSQLATIARQNMRMRTPVPDGSEDAALSVMVSLLRGFRKSDKLQALRDREGLWSVLRKMVRQKIIDYVRKERALKRGGGRVLREQALGLNADEGQPTNLAQFADERPDPRLVLEMEDMIEHILACLKDNSLRALFQLKLEGATNREIAKRLGCSTRTVERRVAIIRQTCERELAL